jgi:hypothetical protein
MKEKDFRELLVQEGNISPRRWVKSFFFDGLTYGARLETRKLGEEEVDNDILGQSARTFNTTPDKLRTMILSQKENVILTYRETWREDLLELTYVPALGKFVCYGRGEY